MSLPNEHRIEAWQEALFRILRTDPWVATGLGIGLILGAALLWAPPPTPSESVFFWIARLAVVFMALWVLPAATTCLGRCTYLRERRFWLFMLPAQAAFVVSQITIFLLPSSTQDGALGWTSWVSDLSLGIFFALTICAAELRPDRRRSADTTRLDSIWVQPAAALFVVSLLLYFPGISHWQSGPWQGLSRLNPQAAGSEQQSLLLYSTLAAFLAGRFTLFSLETGSLRWRFQYRALAAAFVAILAADWLPFLEIDGTDWISRLAFGSASWFLMIAAGLNRLTFAGSGSRKVGSMVSLDLSSAHRNTTLLWALTLPFLHILLHRLGVLPEAHREARELLVLVAVVVLGIYAAAQRYWVEHETINLWQKHRAMGEQLQSSEQDLRVLVERQRGFRELEQSERKFAIAFRLSPDGMMISTVQGGVVLDVNESFCRLVGSEPESVIGRSTLELGYWADESQRDSILRSVLTRGGLRDMAWAPPSLQRSGGPEHEEPQRLYASFELIHTGNERLILSIVRDASTYSPISEIDLLSPSGTAVFATDHHDQVLFWSRSATALFGREEHTVLGEPAEAVGLPVASHGRRTSGGDHRIYRGRATSGDGRPLRLTCFTSDWEAQPDDQHPEASASGRITFASPSRKEPRAFNRSLGLP